MDAKDLEDINLSSPDGDRSGDVETGVEVPTGVSRSRRDKNRRDVTVFIAFLVIVVVVGLSVGLTQRSKTGGTEGSAVTAPTTQSAPSNLPRPVILDEDYGKSL